MGGCLTLGCRRRCSPRLACADVVVFSFCLALSALGLCGAGIYAVGQLEDGGIAANRLAAATAALVAIEAWSGVCAVALVAWSVLPVAPRIRATVHCGIAAAGLAVGAVLAVEVGGFDVGADAQATQTAAVSAALLATAGMLHITGAVVGSTRPFQLGAALRLALVFAALCALGVLGVGMLVQAASESGAWFVVVPDPTNSQPYEAAMVAIMTCSVGFTLVATSSDVFAQWASSAIDLALAGDGWAAHVNEAWTSRRRRQRRKGGGLAGFLMGRSSSDETAGHPTPALETRRLGGSGGDEPTASDDAVARGDSSRFAAVGGVTHWRNFPLWLRPTAPRAARSIALWLVAICGLVAAVTATLVPLAAYFAGLLGLLGINPDDVAVAFPIFELCIAIGAPLHAALSTRLALIADPLARMRALVWAGALVPTIVLGAISPADLTSLPTEGTWAFVYFFFAVPAVTTVYLLVSLALPFALGLEHDSPQPLDRSRIAAASSLAAAYLLATVHTPTLAIVPLALHRGWIDPTVWVPSILAFLPLPPLVLLLPLAAAGVLSPAHAVRVLSGKAALPPPPATLPRPGGRVAQQLGRRLVKTTVTGSICHACCCRFCGGRCAWPLGVASSAYSAWVRRDWVLFHGGSLEEIVAPPKRRQDSPGDLGSDDSSNWSDEGDEDEDQAGARRRRDRSRRSGAPVPVGGSCCAGQRRRLADGRVAFRPPPPGCVPCWPPAACLGEALERLHSLGLALSRVAVQQFRFVLHLAVHFITLALLALRLFVPVRPDIGPQLLLAVAVAFTLVFPAGEAAVLGAAAAHRHRIQSGAGPAAAAAAGSSGAAGHAGAPGKAGQAVQTSAERAAARARASLPAVGLAPVRLGWLLVLALVLVLGSVVYAAADLADEGGAEAMWALAGVAQSSSVRAIGVAGGSISYSFEPMRAASHTAWLGAMLALSLPAACCVGSAVRQAPGVFSMFNPRLARSLAALGCLLTVILPFGALLPAVAAANTDATSSAVLLRWFSAFAGILLVGGMSAATIAINSQIARFEAERKSKVAVHILRIRMRRLGVIVPSELARGLVDTHTALLRQFSAASVASFVAGAIPAQARAAPDAAASGGSGGSSQPAATDTPATSPPGTGADSNGRRPERGATSQPQQAAHDRRWQSDQLQRDVGQQPDLLKLCRTIARLADAALRRGDDRPAALTDGGPLPAVSVTSVLKPEAVRLLSESSTLPTLSDDDQRWVKLPLMPGDVVSVAKSTGEAVFERAGRPSATSAGLVRGGGGGGHSAGNAAAATATAAPAAGSRGASAAGASASGPGPGSGQAATGTAALPDPTAFRAEAAVRYAVMGDGTVRVWHTAAGKGSSAPRRSRALGPPPALIEAAVRHCLPVARELVLEEIRAALGLPRRYREAAVPAAWLGAGSDSGAELQSKAAAPALSPPTSPQGLPSPGTPPLPPSEWPPVKAERGEGAAAAGASPPPMLVRESSIAPGVEGLEAAARSALPSDALIGAAMAEAMRGAGFDCRAMSGAEALGHIWSKCAAEGGWLAWRRVRGQPLMELVTVAELNAQAASAIAMMAIAANDEQFGTPGHRIQGGRVSVALQKGGLASVSQALTWQAQLSANAKGNSRARKRWIKATLRAAAGASHAKASLGGTLASQKSLKITRSIGSAAAQAALAEMREGQARSGAGGSRAKTGGGARAAAFLKQGRAAGSPERSGDGGARAADAGRFKASVHSGTGRRAADSGAPPPFASRSGTVSPAEPTRSGSPFRSGSLDVGDQGSGAASGRSWGRAAGEAVTSG
ncbi:hypothetical protein FNF31_00071 [Cafeteria roenbergensis]|uniref:Uncharacterized protein n=1 Tax=Cafeteria roenbergensis TaxID=33653 RepID=A0A5A8DYN5_CAFRO|nr:hypothetical protein FNF31_00071 [Cafeteria roenbergensis]